MKTYGALSATCIIGVVGLMLAGFSACGSDKKSSDDSTDTKISFTESVNPILKASCSGVTGCHATGTTEALAYVDKEAVFKAAPVSTRMNLDATNSLFMPKSTATEKHSISDADKKTLVDFVAQ